MEKLFLGGLFSYNKLHVVDEQYVDVAVLVPEIVHGRGITVTDGVDELVGEHLGGDIQHPGLGIRLQDIVGDGMHQMGLPQSYASVQEQRIVQFPGGLGHSQRRCMGEGIVLAHHEGVEGVTGVQARPLDIFIGNRCVDSLFLMDPVQIFLQDKADLIMMAGQLLGHHLQKLFIFAQKDLNGLFILRRNDDSDRILADIVYFQRNQPGVEGYLR